MLGRNEQGVYGRESSRRRRWELRPRSRGNTACRCIIPLQPLFHRNQLNSCLFAHLFLLYLEGFLGMSKRHQALVQGRSRFKDEHPKVLATANKCLTKRQDAHATRHGGRLDHLLREQWLGAQARQKGQDRDARGWFSTCAEGLRPALLLGRPRFEGPACDFYSPSGWVCVRLFYWGDRGWRALSRGYEEGPA